MRRQTVGDMASAVDKLPDEALLELLEHFAEVSGRVSTDPAAPPIFAVEHLRWRALAAEIRAGDDGAVERARAELRNWPPADNSSEIPETKKRKLQLGRKARVALVAFVIWSCFVVYRSSDYHELAGISLPEWDDEDFINNLLIPPGALAAAAFAIKWAISGKAMGKFKINVGFKKLSDLRHEERYAHIFLYPLILVPLGLYVTINGFNREQFWDVIAGVMLTTSPFWILLRFGRND